LGFSLLVLGLSLRDQLAIKWYKNSYKSNDFKERYIAFNNLMAMNSQGINELKDIFLDGSEALEFLAEYWSDVNANIIKSHNVLHFLKNNDKRWIIDPESEEIHPIHVAAYRGWAESFKLLIKKGSQIDSCCYVKLCKNTHGIENNSEELVGSPMHIAAKYNNINIIKTLIEEGVDANALRYRDNSTPLHAAAWSGNRAIMEMLISYGADPNATDVIGCTPLHYLVYKNIPYALTYLSKYNVNIQLKEWDGRTLLHLATANGNIEIVKLLISKGIDVNAKIESGADVNKTALDIAKENGYSEIVKILEMNGAKE
jgi:ankyrin repeat protein